MPGQTLTDRAELDAVKRRRHGVWLGIVGLVGTLGGCTCEAPQDRAGSNVPESCAYDAPLFAPVQTDILFVVDDSNSMSEEQEGVARELPTFVQVLQTGAGVQQNLRVGLVNTSVYSAFFGNQPVAHQVPARVAGCVSFPRRTPVWAAGERWLTDPDPNRPPSERGHPRRSGSTARFRKRPSRRLASRSPGRASGPRCPTAGARTRASSGMARACWSWR